MLNVWIGRFRILFLGSSVLASVIPIRVGVGGEFGRLRRELRTKIDARWLLKALASTSCIPRDPLLFHSYAPPYVRHASLPTALGLSYNMKPSLATHNRRRPAFTALFLVLHAVSSVADGGFTEWSARRLLGGAFSSLYGSCPQGPQQLNTVETMLNHHDWWEHHWGRSDDAWPRRGFQECWDNRSDVCALPNQDHVVCLPGSRRGSTVSRGWALDPKSQACQPGVHCLYACEPGYYWTQFNQGETSNFDFVNAHQRGHCDGTWDYGTSSHGVYCREDGTLELPPEPLCKMGETFVYAENRLDKHVFLCQTVFPGHEIFLIPTLVRPGETVMITTQPIDYWGGPTYGKSPHGDIYVSFAGADIMEACTWDEFSPSGAALLPYEIGTGVEDDGFIYSAHYFYQQPNSEVPANMVGYVMDLQCESTEPDVCGDRVAHNNVITMITKRKPPAGSTKLKFVFKKPEEATSSDYQYREPNKPHMPDPMMITGLRDNMGYSSSPFAALYHSHYHRKLRAVEQTTAFLENTLTVPIVACGSENGVRAPGMSVGPGEIVQLPEDGTFFVGLKGETWLACAEMSNLPWVIDLDAANQTYAFQPHPNTGLLDQPLLYSLQLECTSDEDFCTQDSSHRVTLRGGAEIVFRVKGLASSPMAPQPHTHTYDWGQSISKLLSSFFSHS